MNLRSCLLVAVFMLCLVVGNAADVSSSHKKPSSKKAAEQKEPWRGIHLFLQSDKAAEDLAQELPNLKEIGVNVIIVEVGYSFRFKSHPELRNGKGVSRYNAKALAAAARKQGIRLIPELDCLGHQSWRKADAPLLRTYPDFAEPVGSNTDTNGAHLHSWCPQNPKVYKVVLPLIDELVEAFDADAFHVGMDEVFCIASDRCPRCKGKDPAALFAKAVNDLHRHIVDKRKWEMLMWGDRLLDSKSLGYSKWESSRNGTHGAIDLIPKDIVICDWHYEQRTNYPSIPLLLEKGFRVWPAGFQPVEAAKALSDFSRKQKNPRLIGYLGTAWSKANAKTAATWPPFVVGLKEWKDSEDPAK